MSGPQALNDLIKAICIAAVFWLGMLSALYAILPLMPDSIAREIVDTIDTATFNKLYPDGADATLRSKSH